ncbi:Mov34/MPN/PAD-1 family protein [Cellulomonas sp. P24]|uniref:Mov34/MPN/PAD-1 family protein n=1 Tax=Cellulomonas sp. P24 TaxID=2885206 RepID=UPI00216B38C4|nr:Mov34/MPN/PAD-1 family protein [Cellulomonas sp. P24]MCR6491127.1 Mov34/MPN/PAD-1 family protein [Cellulomonas sp. P24]
MVATAWSLSIPRSVLQGILRLADDGERELETGGILLGHEDEPASTTRVTTAGDPGPAAVRQPRFFSRDLQHSQQLADMAWRLDHSQWIGEWHTHPHGQPVPSRIDHHSYLRHVRDPELGFARFVSLLVAIGPQRRTLVAAWITEPNGTSPAKLDVTDS